MAEEDKKKKKVSKQDNVQVAKQGAAEIMTPVLYGQEAEAMKKPPKNKVKKSTPREAKDAAKASDQMKNAFSAFLPMLVGGLFGGVETAAAASTGAMGALERDVKLEAEMKRAEPSEMSEYQRRNLEIQEERMDFYREQEKRRVKGHDLKTKEFGHRRAKDASLSDAQVRDVEEVQVGLDGLSRIQKLMDMNIDTGPIASRTQALQAKYMGSDSPFVDLQAELGSNLANYARSISGGQVAASEFDRLMKVAPDINDPTETRKRKFNTFKRILLGIADAREKAIERGQPLKALTVKNIIDKEEAKLKKGDKAPAQVPKETAKAAPKKQLTKEEKEELESINKLLGE